MRMYGCPEGKPGFHDHPSNPSTCRAWHDHYGTSCPCDDGRIHREDMDLKERLPRPPQAARDTREALAPDESS